ncbi:MAG: hypothetical protein ACPLPR_04060 [Bacillota bacterium]
MDKVRRKLIEPLELALKLLTGEFLRGCEGNPPDLETCTKFLLDASWLLKAKVVGLLPSQVQSEEIGAEVDVLGEQPEDRGGMDANRLFVERSAGAVASLIGSGQWALPRGGQLPGWPPKVGLDREEFFQVCQRVARRLRPIELRNEEGIWRRLFREIARKLFRLRGSITFSQLVGGQNTRRKVAGLLVLLELGRRRRVSLLQNEAFGDILIAPKLGSSKKEEAAV